VGEALVGVKTSWLAFVMVPESAAARRPGPVAAGLLTAPPSSVYAIFVAR